MKTIRWMRRTADRREKPIEEQRSFSFNYGLEVEDVFLAVTADDVGVCFAFNLNDTVEGGRLSIMAAPVNPHTARPIRVEDFVLVDTPVRPGSDRRPDRLELRCAATAFASIGRRATSRSATASRQPNYCAPTARPGDHLYGAIDDQPRSTWKARSFRPSVNQVREDPAGRPVADRRRGRDLCRALQHLRFLDRSGGQRKPLSSRRFSGVFGRRMATRRRLLRPAKQVSAAAMAGSTRPHQDVVLLPLDSFRTPSAVRSCSRPRRFPP